MDETLRLAFGASLSLLAGYVFIHGSYIRRFSVEHLRTDRYALQLLIWSIAFFALGDLISQRIPNWEGHLFAEFRKDINAAGLTPAICNAILAAYVSAKIQNLWVYLCVRRKLPPIRIRARGTPDDDFRAMRSVIKAIFSQLRSRARLAAVALYVKKSNDAMLRTVFRALMLKKIVMVTLKSGKVYIGEPLVPDPDPARAFTSLRILPVASGVRAKGTKKVQLTTMYSALDSEIKRLRSKDAKFTVLDSTDPLITDVSNLEVKGEIVPVDIEDLGIVIIWAEIESLTIWDPNIYSWFQSQPPLQQRSVP